MPLAGIFKSVADGHPFVEIAESSDSLCNQLMAILQFAAEGAAPSGGYHRGTEEAELGNVLRAASQPSARKNPL